MKNILITSFFVLTACHSSNAPPTQSGQKKPSIRVATCQELPASLPTAEMARRCFDRNGPGLNALYQQSLRQNRNLEGKVIFKITVGEGGEVEKLELTESTLPEGKLLKNIQTYVGLMRFHRNLAFSTFPYTLNFYRN
jgi:hypothetical protein